MLRRVLIGLAIIAWASGCGDDGGAATPAPEARFELSFDEDAGRLDLTRDGERLVRFGADGIQLGVVDEVSASVNYDPYHFVGDDVFQPEGLQFLRPEQMRLLDQDDEGMLLRLDYADDLGLDMRIEHHDAGRHEVSLTPRGDFSRVAFYRIAATVDEDEAFYGLGEYFDHVNHRGQVRAMQMELDLDIESQTNEAHVPVPFFIGTGGWGLFVESRYPAAFDMGSLEDDLVESTHGLGSDAADGLTFHLFAAEHPLDVLKPYYEVTGYPKLPAPWALGPWIWRDEVTGEDQVRDDLATIRDEDLATSGYWIDRPYASAVNSFDFDPEMFEDPAGMIETAHDMGFRMALWHTPYLDKEAEATASLFAEATDAGYFPSESGLVFNSWSVPIDFSNEEAVDFWREQLSYYTDLGIEGFKLDYGEDIAPGLPSSRVPWAFADGSDERTMHQRYSGLYHQPYADLMPEDGGFLLCRAASYGGQTQGVIIWPGDVTANLAKHREEVELDGMTYNAVGGVPAVVVAGSSLAASGFAFFGSDTGGYRRDPPDEETYRRWYAHTALSTVMQVGTNSNVVPWEYERWGFDAVVLDEYRDYARLHLRLWPYLWSYAVQMADDGRPIQRALGLAYPELGVHPDDVYLLGDDLLVAPVVEAGVTERSLPLPEGDWFDWWTGERHAGGGEVTLDAPIGSLPLLVRAGGIVPMLRPDIDTLAPAKDDDIESYAEDPGVLYLRVAPGPKSERTLFDGTVIRQRKGRVSATPGTVFTAGIVAAAVGSEAEPVDLSDGKTRAIVDD